MKVAIFSDIHFNAFKPFATFENGENSRFLEITDAFEWVMEDAEKRNCSHGLVGGDIFHTRGALRPSIFNRVFDAINDCYFGMELLMIPGNHDMENYRGGHSAIDTFAYLARVSVVFEPMWHMVGGMKIGCIPYIHNIDEFKKAFVQITERNQPSAFLIHQGIDNFANPGMPDLGLTVEWIREHTDKPVFAGHYHKPMERDNVFSIGSLVKHGFGDTDVPHGYRIWDTDDNSFEFVEVPGPEFVTISKASEAKETEGKYVRAVAKTIKQAEKLGKVATDAGAKGVVLKVDKEFKTAHDQSIALAGPKTMLTEYLNMKHKHEAAELLGLFDKICEGGAP